MKFDVLKRLRSRRVFSVKMEEGLIYFDEECDGCFGVGLNKDEFMQLINELNYIHGHFDSIDNSEITIDN